MKSGLAVGLLVASVGTASADGADLYPEAVVDRPLVLAPGMTDLLVDAQLASTEAETFESQELDLAVGHAFGPIEVTVDVGVFAELHVAIATHAFPEIVEVFGLTGVPQRDDSLHVAQGALAGQRFHVVPGRLAAVGDLGVTLSENRLPEGAGMLSWSEALAAFADARLEVQAARGLALFVDAGVNVPVAHFGGPDFDSSLVAGGGGIVTLASWDLFARAGLDDLTRPTAAVPVRGVLEAMGHARRDPAR